MQVLSIFGPKNKISLLVGKGRSDIILGKSMMGLEQRTWFAVLAIVSILYISI